MDLIRSPWNRKGSWILKNYFPENKNPSWSDGSSLQYWKCNKPRHSNYCSTRDRTIISPSHEAEQLKSLSVHLLNLIPDHQKIFFLWGIRTLGDLANLPDVGLVKRLGLEGKRLKTLAQGKHNRPLVPINKDLNFQESLELDFPIEKTEALLFVLFRLLNLICTKMNSKRLSASNLSLY